MGWLEVESARRERESIDRNLLKKLKRKHLGKRARNWINSGKEGQSYDTSMTVKRLGTFYKTKKKWQKNKK